MGFSPAAVDLENFGIWNLELVTSSVTWPFDFALFYRLPKGKNPSCSLVSEIYSLTGAESQ